MPRAIESWGRYPRIPQHTYALNRRPRTLPPLPSPLLAHGLGRSYGDSCLTYDGTLLLTRGMDRWISFDPTTGRLSCEAGVSLDEILQLCVPAGWFLPVTPGTRYVTVGGAIANDVHGKNHHRAGTFGAHVRSLELLRSDGTHRLCTREHHVDWFRATIGGLGLTGLITRAELQLRPIVSPFIDTDTLRIRDLNEFFDLADSSDLTHEYTVAWIDCLASGDRLGRGLFLRGNHSLAPDRLTPPKRPFLRIPVTAPPGLLNPVTVRIFNTFYAAKLRGEQHFARLHYQPFFYPLDGVAHWNRLYGPRGFLQYQCVVPRDGYGGAIRDILRRIAASGQASFLAVLKLFGSQPAEGLLSFPRPGVTLALDFPHRGESTLRLLRELDEVVFAHGGALYPAKDARMSPEHFRRSFPAIDTFAAFRDPAFESAFWKRVQGTT